MEMPGPNSSVSSASSDNACQLPRAIVSSSHRNFRSIGTDDELGRTLLDLQGAASNGVERSIGHWPLTLQALLCRVLNFCNK